MSASYDFRPESSNTETVYDICAQANNEAKPDDFKMVIKQVILRGEGACYREMEQYLRPPGVTGSKAFDQGQAVNVLLKHDWLHANRDGGENVKVGTLRQLMSASKANEREIWDRLVSVMRDIGMRFKHGRLVGAKMLEEQPDDDGQPDIG